MVEAASSPQARRELEGDVICCIFRNYPMPFSETAPK